MPILSRHQHKDLLYPVVWIMALSCEARPLITHYALKRVHEVSAFKLFHARGMWLIVSGAGKIAAAASVGYMAGHLGNAASKAIWLNAGIARHPLLDIGACRWVGKVIDQATKKAIYPMLSIAPVCLASDCITVDETAYDLEVNSLFDMEASGFFFSVIRYTTLEQVHAFKIVSDNHQHAPEHIAADHATALIAEQLSCMDEFLQRLMLLRDNYWETQDSGLELYTKILALQHFTKSTQTQLHKLIRRTCALKLKEEVDTTVLGQLKNGKAVIQYLDELVSSHPASFL